jgi:hypothetical protein
MKEKDFQTKFTEWVRENPDVMSTNSAMELKLCKLKSMPFDRVDDHQILALQAVKHQHLYHKITDQPFIGPCERCGFQRKYMFTAKKPFDCFILSKANAFVVIWWYKEGVRKGNREMIFIDIDDFVNEKLDCGRKSITEQRAKELGKVVFF